MNKFIVLLINVFLIISMFINKILNNINLYLIEIKERNYIKKYKINKHIYNAKIPINIKIEENECIINIKDKVILLNEKEFDLMLEIFEDLNKKVIK